MSAAVVGRLHAAVEMTKASPTVAPLVVLDITEAENILNLLADSCPDHLACEECGARFCDTCEVSAAAPCDHGRILCQDCPTGCRVCATDMEPEYDPELDPCWGDR